MLENVSHAGQKMRRRITDFAPENSAMPDDLATELPAVKRKRPREPDQVDDSETSKRGAWPVDNDKSSARSAQAGAGYAAMVNQDVTVPEVIMAHDVAGIETSVAGSPDRLSSSVPESGRNAILARNKPQPIEENLPHLSRPNHRGTRGAGQPLKNSRTYGEFLNLSDDADATERSAVRIDGAT